MTEPKFTPGTWGVSDLRQKKELLEICAFNADTDKLVCVASIDHRINKLSLDEEDMSNANLIAAAPDMYEALEDVCHDCCDESTTDEICMRCRVGMALHKARGEE